MVTKMVQIECRKLAFCGDAAHFRNFCCKITNYQRKITIFVASFENN